ncbi:MAG: dethiobiotin synthase [Deltaproteobacteria bacterium]|nr:dethiobiotin synthase [Deltaproteobacteria bacterium]
MPHLKQWFVTGTDTGVGKTTLCRALLAAAAARGLRTAAMKPAESGCRRDPREGLVPADALALRQAASVAIDLGAICPYRFEAAVAPGVAAEELGETIDFTHIGRCRERICEAGPDLLLIEGAGGLLVPLGAGRTIADLARFLGAPLLVVARDSLGTINHTLLTVEVARGRGLAVGAVVLSACTPDTPEGLAASNAREIERGCAVPVLGRLPHVRGGEDLASVAEHALGVGRLVGPPDVVAAEVSRETSAAPAPPGVSRETSPR